LKNNFWRTIAVYAVFALVIWGLWQLLFGAPVAEEIPYYQFKEMVSQGQVKEAELGDTEITGTLADGKSYRVVWSKDVDPNLVAL